MICPYCDKRTARDTRGRCRECGAGGEVEPLEREGTRLDAFADFMWSTGRAYLRPS